MDSHQKIRAGMEAKVIISLKIITMYKWLLDAYVLDFYVDKHWSKLPRSWQHCFKDMDPKTFGSFIKHLPCNTCVAPLSFLALLKITEMLSIPRIPKTAITNDKQENKKNDKFMKLFLKHVKLKKRHEIDLMAQSVAKLAQETGCKLVVDFGSGLGHLVRTLSFKFHLDTVGVEQQCQLSEDAKKLDKELCHTGAKYLGLKDMKNPTHVNTTVVFGKNLEFTNDEHYGIVGLHPCGDLGPNLINHFAQNDLVKFVCVVGCCYMKVIHGYPMSKFVKTIKYHELSFESREIACHALEVYCDRLCSGDYHDLQVHSYRAMLELLLVKKSEELKHCGIRSVKHKKGLTFQRYCELATERLNVDLDRADILSDETYAKLLEWRRVVIFYTCRLILAPLIETVMLYDRLIYLWECGFDAELEPVFDPRLSPRNHILIAKR